VDNFAHETLLVGDQVRVEHHPALEGVIPEDSLAEAVNGEDRGLIKIVQRAPQAPRGMPGRRLAAAECREERISGAVARDPGEGFAQAALNAFLQFIGGGIGEGDHQDFIDEQVLFQQQPQKQSCNGVGLSRTGAGFDEVGAITRAVQEVESNALRSVRHRFSSLSEPPAGAQTLPQRDFRSRRPTARRL